MTFPHVGAAGFAKIRIAPGGFSGAIIVEICQIKIYNAIKSPFSWRPQPSCTVP
jgi:hypothetical protein